MVNHCLEVIQLWMYRRLDSGACATCQEHISHKGPQITNDVCIDCFEEKTRG